MKIQFDPKQQYQLDAVSAVVDIFDGQPLEKSDFSIIYRQEFSPGVLHGLEQTELGVANRLTLTDTQLKANVRAVQVRNDVETQSPDVALESWALLGQNREFLRYCFHYSVEMETGTGKTYVYL